jgi:hypothetical protein
MARRTKALGLSIPQKLLSEGRLSPFFPMRTLKFFVERLSVRARERDRLHDILPFKLQSRARSTLVRNQTSIATERT